MHSQAPTLSSKEAASYIGMSESWLRRSRMAHSPEEGPPYLKLGGTVRYLRSDLEEWLLANRATKSLAQGG